MRPFLFVMYTKHGMGLPANSRDISYVGRLKLNQFWIKIQGPTLLLKFFCDQMDKTTFIVKVGKAEYL